MPHLRQARWANSCRYKTCGFRLMGVWCVAICLGANTPQISISGVAAFYLATLIQIFLWGREALGRIARVFLVYVSNFIDVLGERGKIGFTAAEPTTRWRSAARKRGRCQATSSGLSFCLRNQRIALEVKMAWRDPRKCSAGRPVRGIGLDSRCKVRRKFGSDAIGCCMDRLAPLRPSDG